MIRLEADISRIRWDVKPYIPPSKSISNRALLLGHLCADGPSPIKNLSRCDDTLAMERGLHAANDGSDVELTVNVGGAGTAMRFLTAYYASQPGCRVLLTGNERMKQRPIAPLVEALRRLGAAIDYAEEVGFPPLHICGQTLHGGQLTMNGSISSQFVSALLMVAPLTEGITLTLTGNIVSRPYIDMTLALMAHYGITARWMDSHTVSVPQGFYHSHPLTVETDWSAASYWMAMRKVGEQPLPYLSIAENSLQGDSICVQLLNDMPTNFDFSPCPDLVQTMAVSYSLMGRPFVFSGVGNLRLKETDRLQALTCELAKLGYDVRCDGHVLRSCYAAGYHPDTVQADTVIETYNDHRMAMAFAPAALRMGSIIINHPEVVSKSYPGFWDDLRHIGFTITEL